MDAPQYCRVLFFSVLRDATGKQEMLWPLPAADFHVKDLLGGLAAHFPKLAPWLGSLLVAVDLEYATEDTRVHEGAEVAIMPPVQGG